MTVAVRMKRYVKNCEAAIDVGIYIVERIFMHRETLEQAVGLTDELTGLPNNKAYLRTTRRLKKGFCIVLIDVDNLKKCNDARGHTYGDRILCRVADALRKIMSDHVVAYRLHGDEFILVCDSLKTARAASRIIRRNIRATDEVTVSQGICRIRGGETVDQALQKADRALYSAKRNGKDTIAVYGDSARAAKPIENNVSQEGGCHGYDTEIRAQAYGR